MEAAGSPIQDARDAAGRHAWQEAFDLFSAAESSGGLVPEDIESLAEAAWWTGHIDECIEARERAYAAYIELGQGRQAAAVALRLTADYFSRMALSVGTGFLNRARRLLQEQPECPEQGYLACTLAHVALTSNNLEPALDYARQAFEIGGRFGDRDLQTFALQEQGQILVAKGEVAEGLALLDESMVAAVSGELGPYFTGLIFCGMIGTCRELADYRRAGEWAEAAERAFERRHIAIFPGDCRLHRAEILRLRGDWTEAEQEARRACDELRAYDLHHVGIGFYEIGEVRLRSGDLAAAEEAFRQAHELGREPQPGLALLELGEGNVDAAATMIRRALESNPGDRLARARLLPAQVEIAVAASDLETARAAVQELEGVGEMYGTQALQASAACARGALQLAEGDSTSATLSLHEGWRLWQEVGAPYEAAKARELLAAAHQAEGDRVATRLELQAAKSAFEQLGAVSDARRAAEALGTLGVTGSGRTAVAGRRVTKTFMFTDIVRSTNLVEAIGDEAWADLLRWHDRTLRSLFRDHMGEEINHAGDGFFVAFADTAKAIECAVAVQRTLAEHRSIHGFSPQVRIGVHASEVSRRGRDYWGKGVHVAARIAQLAEGEEILASEETLAAGSVPFPASDPRTVHLKGLSEPIQVARIAWR